MQGETFYPMSTVKWIAQSACAVSIHKGFEYLFWLEPRATWSDFPASLPPPTQNILICESSTCFTKQKQCKESLTSLTPSPQKQYIHQWKNVIIFYKVLASIIDALGEV